MKKLMVSIAAILMIGLLAACTEEEEPDANETEEESVTPVETAEASEGDLVVEKSVYGRTAPNRTTPVMLQAPGEIDTLEVANGDMVEEDDLIATVSTQAGTQNIRAPKDGEITNLQAAEGEMATTEEPIAVVADLDTVKLQLTATADVRDLFSVEDTLNVLIDGNEYEAEVTSVGTMPDDTTLYPIEATVDNEDREIIPGLVAEVTVPESTVEDTIIVPTEAVVEEDDEAFVYVVNEDSAVQTTVTIQETQSEQTAIEGEVQAGDEIVVNGQLTLGDGDTVEVVEGE
ncbi:efflux RND transporter periplasmic adaptor subunit [Virgibacillus ainsalahensis]